MLPVFDSIIVVGKPRHLQRIGCGDFVPGRLPLISVEGEIDFSIGSDQTSMQEGGSLKGFGLHYAVIYCLSGDW